MTAVEGVKLILSDVWKGLLTIPFPPDPVKDSTLELHWCEKCQRYHRVT
jgi:hypothetical protein